MTSSGTGAREPLLLCAFDHRDFFERLVDEHAGAQLSRFASVALAKELVLQAALAVRDRAPAGRRQGLGIFVDEQYGALVALRARAAGLLLAMPAERSGAAEFQCEFGDRFATHVEAFDPHLVKVLVRHTPGDDAALLHRQAARLRELSDWCRDAGRQLLVELLVPPLDGRAGPDFAAGPRLPLTLRALDDLVTAGVRPAVWKLEDPGRADGYACLVDACRAADPDVRVVVLGGGASVAATVEGIAAAAAAGFDGFAVGRTIWAGPLSAWLGGHAGREETIAAMAEVYESCIGAYRAGVARRPVEVRA